MSVGITWENRFKIFPFLLYVTVGVSQCPVLQLPLVWGGVPKGNSALRNNFYSRCVVRSWALCTHASAKIKQNIFQKTEYITLPENMQYLSQPSTFLFILYNSVKYIWGSLLA